MDQGLNNLKAKGYSITEAEQEAAEIAILLHDIGHGPFSHVLENTILKEVKHEEVSNLLMKKLNEYFNGRL
jgi:HD superfamily phosphohydrolase